MDDLPREPFVRAMPEDERGGQWYLYAEPGIHYVDIGYTEHGENVAMRYEPVFCEDVERFIAALQELAAIALSK